MKRKNSLGLFSGLALGLASIYALTIYFGVTSTQLKDFMLSTALLLAAMFIAAAVLVGLIKLAGKLLGRSKDVHQQDSDTDQE